MEVWICWSLIGINIFFFSLLFLSKDYYYFFVYRWLGNLVWEEKANDIYRMKGVVAVRGENTKYSLQVPYSLHHVPSHPLILSSSLPFILFCLFVLSSFHPFTFLSLSFHIPLSVFPFILSSSALSHYHLPSSSSHPRNK
jgi:hypothetical protein